MQPLFILYTHRFTICNIFEKHGPILLSINFTLSSPYIFYTLTTFATYFEKQAHYAAHDFYSMQPLFIL